MFGYDNEISGYLDQDEFVPIGTILAGQELGELQGFVAPDTADNSKPNTDLLLFEDPQLTKVVDSTSVTDRNRPIIFLMPRTPACQEVAGATERERKRKCALLVKYAPNVRVPPNKLLTAYIRLIDDRAESAESFDKRTFRIQRVSSTKLTAGQSECKADEKPTNQTEPNCSLLERAFHRAATFLSNAVDQAKNTLDQGKNEILKALNCQYDGNIGIELKLKPEYAGFGAGVTAGAGWKKEAM